MIEILLRIMIHSYSRNGCSSTVATYCLLPQCFFEEVDSQTTGARTEPLEVPIEVREVHSNSKLILGTC